MKATDTATFFHRIVVHSTPDPWRERFVFREYSNLRYDQMQRFDWFFRYVAAVAQIRNPRYKIEHTWGVVEVSPVHQRLRFARMSVAARQGMLTKHLEKVQSFLDQHTGLFAATEHEAWPKVEAKTNRLRSELWSAQQRLKELEQQAEAQTA